MEHERSFFESLKRTTLQLVKNAGPNPGKLKPYVELFETRAWHALNAEEKVENLHQINQLTDESTPIAKFFSEYPHEWSKNAFIEMRSEMDALKNEILSA